LRCYNFRINAQLKGKLKFNDVMIFFERLLSEIFALKPFKLLATSRFPANIRIVTAVVKENFYKKSVTTY